MQMPASNARRTPSSKKRGVIPTCSGRLLAVITGYVLIMGSCCPSLLRFRCSYGTLLLVFCQEAWTSNHGRCYRLVRGRMADGRIQAEGGTPKSGALIACPGGVVRSKLRDASEDRSGTHDGAPIDDAQSRDGTRGQAGRV